MILDKNSFNIVTPSECEEIFNGANEYYRSAALDRRLSNTQQVARAYVEAVLTVLVNKGAIELKTKGGEVATDTSSITSD